MRAVPPLLESALRNDRSEVAYLISTTLDEPVRYSTLGDINVNGEMYRGGTVRDLTSQDWSTCSFRIANPRGALTPFMLSGAWRDQPVTVSIASIEQGDFFEPGFFVDGFFANYAVTTMTLFEGVLSSASSIAPMITLQCVRSAGLFVPAWRVGRPVFNHLPVPGSTITWQGQTITIESR